MSNVYEDYSLVLQRFLHHGMSPEEFQITYLNMFKNESRELNESLFEVLDTLFGDVDAFSGDDARRNELEIQNPGFYVDENELRQRVAHSLERLVSLQREDRNRAEGL